MSIALRKFAYQHPIFGRSKKERSHEKYRNSVYYYWYEFLKRNEDYVNCCRANGAGSLSALYADFGDVFGVDFKTWWQKDDRGATLFAEKLLPKFGVVTVDQIQSKADILFIQVPLSLPKKYLASEFQKVLNKYHHGSRGKRTNAISTALYPVVGHVDIESIDKCLRVYDLRVNNKNLPLWCIAELSGIVKKAACVSKSDTKSEMSSKKLVSSNAASRLLRRAKRLIENVGQGEFPGK